MKMPHLYLSLVMFVIAGATLTSCSKQNEAQPQNKLNAISANWTTTAWGGEQNDPLNFTIDPSTAIGTVTSIGGETFNFKPGDHLYFNIKANTDGTYSAQGKYTYGPNNASTSTRDCTLSLQNGGSQLTAFYPAIPGFPNLTYIYQKGTTREESL
jgi:hypothetical protein